MLHIYRQITGLKRCAPLVIAQKRENAERYPFEPLRIIPKLRTHFLRRFWFRQFRDKPWQISHAEVSKLLSVLTETRARLLHIYFGHIGVHLLPQSSRGQIHRLFPSTAPMSWSIWISGLSEATLEMFDAVKLVLVRSESLRRAIVDLGCDPEKIEIQRTGIPLDEFPFRGRAVPENGEWQFVQAGRLIEKKGLPVTLRAFSTFLKQHPNATLTIAGEGPLLSELQRFAHELGVADRVSFTGFVSQEQLRRSIIDRTYSCTRARLGATEIKKAFQIRCSKQWPRAYRCSPPNMAAFPKQLRMASAACLSQSTIRSISANNAQRCTRSRFAFANRARGCRGSGKHNFDSATPASAAARRSKASSDRKAQLVSTHRN